METKKEMLTSIYACFSDVLMLFRKATQCRNVVTVYLSFSWESKKSKYKQKPPPPLKLRAQKWFSGISLAHN